MTIEDIDVPWHLQKEEIKQWCRDNNFVIRENNDKTGVTILSSWLEHYLKEHA
jgi:hypothetical protein